MCTHYNTKTQDGAVAVSSQNLIPEAAAPEEEAGAPEEDPNAVKDDSNAVKENAVMSGRISRAAQAKKHHKTAETTSKDHFVY